MPMTSFSVRDRPRCDTRLAQACDQIGQRVGELLSPRRSMPLHTTRLRNEASDPTSSGVSHSAASRPGSRAPPVLEIVVRLRPVDRADSCYRAFMSLASCPVGPSRWQQALLRPRPSYSLTDLHHCAPPWQGIATASGLAPQAVPRHADCGAPMRFANVSVACGRARRISAVPPLALWKAVPPRDVRSIPPPRRFD